MVVSDDMNRWLDEIKRYPGLLITLKDFLIATDMMSSDIPAIASRGYYYRGKLYCYLRLVGLPGDVESIFVEIVEWRDSQEAGEDE